jgi:thiamine biosynthesis protein ThiC
MLTLSPFEVMRTVLQACEATVSFVPYHSGITDACIKLRARQRVANIFYHEGGHVPLLICLLSDKIKKQELPFSFKLRYSIEKVRHERNI